MHKNFNSLSLKTSWSAAFSLTCLTEKLFACINNIVLQSWSVTLHSNISQHKRHLNCSKLKSVNKIRFQKYLQASRILHNSIGCKVWSGICMSNVKSLVVCATRRNWSTKASICWTFSYDNCKNSWFIILQRLNNEKRQATNFSIVIKIGFLARRKFA